LNHPPFDPITIGHDVTDPFEPFDVELLIRRSAKARRRRIVVTPGKIEVVAPEGTPDREIHLFLRQKGEWVRRQVRQMQQQRALVPPLAPSGLLHGAHLPYFGTLLPLKIEPRHGINRPAIAVDEMISAHLPAHWDHDVRAQKLPGLLTQWMKTELLAAALPLAQHHAEALGVVPAGLRVKQQRHLWGSCGQGGIINLNWRLIFAPLSAVEYVVVHELAHLRHRNHSPRFWSMVERHLPDFRERQEWLKQPENMVLYRAFEEAL